MIPALPSSLAPLIAAIRHAAHPHRTAMETVNDIVRLLAARAGAIGLDPEARRPDPSRYRQHLLHAEPDGSFSLAALVWLPGQATPVHDHRGWCVVAVLEGEEVEMRYRRAAAGGRLEPVARAVNRAGCVQGLLDPGEVHRVANESDAIAVSLHVYGTDLRRCGTSIASCYDP